MADNLSGRAVILGSSCTKIPATPKPKSKEPPKHHRTKDDRQCAADAIHFPSSLSLHAGVSSQRSKDDQRSLVAHGVSSTAIDRNHGGNLHCAEYSGQRIDAGCPRSPLQRIHTNSTPNTNRDAAAQRSTKRVCRREEEDVDICRSTRAESDDEEDGDDDDEDDDYDEDYEFSTSTTTPQNIHQQNAIDTYRGKTCAMVKDLVYSGQIRNPAGYNAGNLVVEKLQKLGDTNHPVEYACMNGPKKGKLGMTGNGEKRNGYYDEKGDKTERIVTFDLERQNEEQHKTMMNSLHTIMRNSHSIDPANLREMTLADAVELQEEKGLAFFAQFTFFCATTTANECSKLCGLNEIRGVMKKLVLGAIETGKTEYLVRHSDWNVNRALQPDEGVVCRDTLDWVLRSNKKVSKAMDRLRQILDGVSRYGPDAPDVSSGNEDMNETYTQYLCREQIVVLADSTWKPNIVSKIQLTPTILDNVVGKGNMRNSFVATPPSHDPYNDALFTSDERAEARDNIDSWMAALEYSFGVELLDRNNAAYADVDYDVYGHHVYGHLRMRGWKHLCDCNVLNIKIYLYYRSDGTWPSMVLVHTAPCWMAPSQPDLKVDADTIESIQLTAVSMFGLGKIVDVLATPDMEAFAFDPDPSKQSIWHNILFAHGWYTHLIVFFHIYRMGACLSLKNCLTPFEQNCYDEEYHGLSLPNPMVLSHRLRKKLRLRPDAMTYDKDSLWEAVNLLSNISGDPNDSSAQYWKDAALTRLSYNEALAIANNESIIDKHVLTTKLYHFDKFMEAGVVTGDLKQFFVDKKAELDHLWDNRRNERQESELAEYRQSLAAGKKAVANMGNLKMSAKAKERHNRLLSKIRK